MSAETEKKIRTFIAFDLKNPDTIEEVKKYQEALEEKVAPVKLVDPELFHITAHFYGDITLEEAEKIYKEIVAPVNEEHFKKPMKGKVKGINHFGHRTYYVEVDGLDKDLAPVIEFIDEKNKEMGYGERRRPFKIHLTVARRRRTRRRPPKGTFERIGAAYEELEGDWKKNKFGKFEIEQLVFKKSILTPKGPIYEDLTFD